MNIRKFLLSILKAFSLSRHEDGIFYINGSDELPPPLSPEEERRCTEALFRGDGDCKAARDLLVEHNLRLVVYIAKKFDNTGVGTEDLVSIGTIGLMKAVTSFDPTKKIKLATYASKCIENEILMFLRNMIWKPLQKQQQLQICLLGLGMKQMEKL